jgi:hypothetical protein
MNHQTSPDVTRTTISVLVIGVPLLATLWTVQAFIGPLIWATAIVVATWPMLESVQRRVGGSRALASRLCVRISRTDLGPRLLGEYEHAPLASGADDLRCSRLRHS